MATFTLEQVLSATRGQLLVGHGVASFTGVSTDTRTLQPGELFVAIHGERHNGHAFLPRARELGAAGVLVSESVPGVRPRHFTPGNWTIIEVTDTLYALGQLAQYHRRRFDIPVIAVTGSAGKTTTKEMTAAILETAGPVLKSHGNFNNEIGLPLTLFQLTREHQAAVLEFGMRGRGQIGYLAALACPTVGVITNIGLSHLELLGSQEEIALAKAELLDEMPPDATAILPMRDPYYPLLSEHARGPVVGIGDDADGDLWVSDIQLAANGCANFQLHFPAGTAPVQLATPGQHQVWNALAAAAAAMQVGASAEQVQQGLAAYQATKGRMHLLRSARGFTVIDDTYNANPAAMRATLEFLAQLPGRRKVAVLGDMRELGPAAATLHQEIGRNAMTLGIDHLIAVGTLGQQYVAGADDPRARWCPDLPTAIEAALSLLEPDDVVLVKGSRAMQMEDVVAGLL